MKLKKFFQIRNDAVQVDLVLLYIRVACGYAFIVHGLSKIHSPGGPLGWMGPETQIPGILQALAVISEFGGGILLIAGFITRLGGGAIACTMLVAICMHIFVFHDPSINLTGGHSYELASAYYLLMLIPCTLGAGRYSLDRKIFGVKV